MKTLTYIILGLVIVLLIGTFLFRGPAPVGSMAINRFSSATNSVVESATTSSFTILSANSGRLYALISNEGTEKVDISLGSTATAGQGIRLDAGESYEITPLNLYVGQISGIASSSATTSIFIVEK